MRFTPSEIKRQQFTKSLRGFNTDEVEAYLDLMATEFESLQRENKELRKKIGGLETQPKESDGSERAAHQTSLNAQETAGKALETAKQEAEKIIQEAELRASKIVEDARNDAVIMKEQLTILEAKKDSILSRLKLLLSSELDLVKAIEVDEQLQEPGDGDQNLSAEKKELGEIIRNLKE